MHAVLRNETVEVRRLEKQENIRTVRCNLDLRTNKSSVLRMYVTDS